MSSLPNFLLIEDDPFLARKLSVAAQEYGYFCVAAANTRQGRMHMEIHGGHLKMVAMSLSATDPSRLQLFQELRRKHPEVAVILLVTPELLPQAAAARAKGAEYLVKPFELPAFQSALSRRSEAAEDVSAAPAPEILRDVAVLLGSSPPMLEVFDRLAKITRTKTPALIQGSAGSGKTLVAEILHTNGPTKLGGKRSVDCAEASAQLYSHLFGSRSGASLTPGVLAQVPEGTLVLENIEAAPLDAQLGILQLLELGSYRAQNCSVAQSAAPKLIFSSTADLAACAASGQLLQELYFRITECPILLPDLAERKSDIPALARKFLRRHENPELLGFSEACWPRLQAYEWPGNLTELEQVVQYAMEKCPRGYIQPEHLPALIEAGESPQLQALRLDLHATLGQWLEERLKCRPTTYDSMLQELESGVLSHLLARYHQKPTFLADALDMNRNTLRKKMEMNGLGKRQNRKPRRLSVPKALALVS